MPLSCVMLPSALGQHYTTLGHNFSVLTSAPVNICIVFHAFAAEGFPFCGSLHFRDYLVLSVSVSLSTCIYIAHKRESSNALYVLVHFISQTL